MSIGLGIAVAGIWLGVGLVAFGSPGAAAEAATCGMVASALVVFHSRP